MVWLTKLKELADRVLGEDQRAKHLREEELQLAAAALLVHASLIDGHADAEERRKRVTRRVELLGVAIIGAPAHPFGPVALTERIEPVSRTSVPACTVPRPVVGLSF